MRGVMNEANPDPSAAVPSVTTEIPRPLLEVRRSNRRLGHVSNLLSFTSLAFLGWLVYEVFILERSDTIYLLLSLFGMASGLGRILVYKVRAVPKPLLDLAHGTPGERDAAWDLISAHREELLGMTELPASIREPELIELDRAQLVERVERHGTTPWPQILRGFLIAWSVILILVLTALALHTPAPVIER
jgi:hypothetical protein